MNLMPARYVIAILFAAFSVVLGGWGAVQAFKDLGERETRLQIEGARRRATLLSCSAVAFYLAVQFYSPEPLCLWFLFIFIGLFWLDYLIYKKTGEWIYKGRHGEQQSAVQPREAQGAPLIFDEYEIVRLKTTIPGVNLPAGAKGTVLIIHDDPGLPRAYEIEFLDDEGESLAVLTVLEVYLEKA